MLRSGVVSPCELHHLAKDAMPALIERLSVNPENRRLKSQISVF